MCLAEAIVYASLADPCAISGTDSVDRWQLDALFAEQFHIAKLTLIAI